MTERTASRQHRLETTCAWFFVAIFK